MQSQQHKPDKVCAIVITYHPDPSVIENVRLLSPQVSEVLVVDNASGPNSAKLLAELGAMPQVRVVRNEKNLGIGAALNIGIKAAAANYDWVITFDQDSSVTPDFMDTMRAAYEACPFRQQVALVSPTHCGSETEWKRKSGKQSGPLFSLIRGAMTSGSLIKTRNLMDAGLYDEPMFIDYVDFDMCLRFWLSGARLIRSRRSFLLHHLGSPMGSSIFGFRFTIIAHSPTRRYYIMRNRITCYRRYALRFPLWTIKDFAWLMIEFAKILFIEDDKGAKLSHALRGLRDGFAGVTGPLSPTA